MTLFTMLLLAKYLLCAFLGCTQTVAQNPSPSTLVRCSESTLVRKSSNLFAAIEVGSKGIKGTVIQQLAVPNEDGHSLIARSAPDEKIKERNANALDANAQAEAVSAVNDMFREIQDRFSVPCQHIVIYGSSGLAQAKHKDALARDIQGTTGRVMEFITVEQEVILSFEGVVPQWRRSQVVWVDVGSGNIKGGYVEDAQNGKYRTFGIPLGTKELTKKINEARGGDGFAKAAERIKREVLVPQLRDAVERNPGLQSLPRVYLAGGISWALATLTRPCDPEQEIDKKEERVARFLRLRAEDINTFYNNVTRDQTSLFNPDLSKCSDEQRKRAGGDIENIKKAFSEDNRIAGAEILRALSAELRFSQKQRIFFARYGIEALPIGYLTKQLEQLQ